jgi:hypothetical protein
MNEIIEVPSADISFKLFSTHIAKSFLVSVRLASSMSCLSSVHRISLLSPVSDAVCAACIRCCRAIAVGNIWQLAACRRFYTAAAASDTAELSAAASAHCRCFSALPLIQHSAACRCFSALPHCRCFSPPSLSLSIIFFFDKENIL